MKYLLHHLVAQSAMRDADRVAVVDGERSISYGDLELGANRLAHLLHDLGVRSGDRVGIYLEKSVEAIVGIYGVMKTGAAYVPLDPNAPAARLSYIAADCGITTLVTAVDKATAWPALAAAGAQIRHIVALDAPEDWTTELPRGAVMTTAAALETFSDATFPSGATDRDLAYVLYTSGSTGSPKGVMLSHQNGMAFVDWAVAEFAVGPGDRLSQFAPLVFDLSTFDLFGAALAGASVHLVSRATTMFPKEVKRFIDDHQISVMYAVPSTLTLLTLRGGLQVGDLGSLRTVLFAGEVFPTKHLSALMRLLPEVEFANLYGPTETNVCTFYRVPEAPQPDGPPVSIGRAIANDETIVVREDGSIATPGEVGELYVRGATVMQGYWGDSERTARTLVANPFTSELNDVVYKTGDLVTERPDGNYTFLGRRDNQIKSRGYRIELGEIEAALLAHPQVLEAAVSAIPDEVITNRLLAHVVGDSKLTAQELTRFCADRIPKYMIPGEFEFVRQLPKTATGKIDRHLLTQAALERVI